jgi:hypothetical protein
LLEANVVETHADFEGEYVRMSSSKNETYPNWGETLELDTVLLHTSYVGGSVIQKNWLLEAFDAGTGESLYNIESSSVSADRGALLRISALNDIPDFDYVMYFENGYAYKNSKDSAQETYFPLPTDVNSIWDDSKSNTPYDKYNDYIAWTEDDGIHLRVAKQDGITQRLILPNSELSKAFPRPDYPDGLAYLSPRFMCNGTKVVAKVFSEITYESNGVVVFDIASGTISEPHKYFPPYSANYPITDRYVAVGNFTPLNLYDVETGEVTEFAQMSIARSYDYKTMIVADYTTLDAHNAPIYVCEIDSPDDRSKPLLRPLEPQATVNLTEVTENYAVFSIRDFDGNWMAAVRYK